MSKTTKHSGKHHHEHDRHHHHDNHHRQHHDHGAHKQLQTQSDPGAGPAASMTEGYEDVCAEQDVAEGELRGVRIRGDPVLIGRVAGQLFAIGGVCTHKQALLEDGELDGWTVCCPRHGGGFDIRTGKAVRSPAVTAVPTYDVKVEGGRVLLSRQPR